MSDLDLGLGFSGTGELPVDAVTDLLRGLGEVVDVSGQPWDIGYRWWVQYVDGGQIDLVLMPAEHRPGHAPGSVVLLDRTGRLREPFTPQAWAARPDEPRQWLLDGWEALSNVAKYIRRGALFEAVEQIHRARTRALQLWAVGEGVSFPSFGLTSLLDDDRATVPAGIEATYPTLERGAILAAGLATAEVLGRAGRHAELDTPLRHYVTERLRGLAL